MATPGQSGIPSNKPSDSLAPAQVAGTLKTDAGAVVDEAKNALGQINKEASTQISQLADQAKEQVAVATDKVRGIAAEQKDLLADQVAGVAEVIERIATDLESNGGPTASYARMIADNAEQFSTTIRDNDVDQIMTKAQDFGRQQPVAFLGAAALLGFAASRFLLASANRAAQPAQKPATTNGFATPGTQQPATTNSFATPGAPYDTGRV